jgi:hypothetical protein
LPKSAPQARGHEVISISCPALSGASEVHSAPQSLQVQ